MPLPFLISCCSIALRNRPVMEAIDSIANAGFEGIEFWYPHVEKLDEAELREVAKHCRGRGLRPTVIAPYFSFTRDEEWRTRSLETARAALKISDILGIKKIRTFVDIGPDGLPSARADASHWQAARAGLQQLCDLDPARAFVVETHGNTLADSLPTIQRLLKEVDRPNLLLNFQYNEDFAERGFMQCLETLYPFVNHMHWQQHLPDGGEGYLEEPGLIDFEVLIGWLAARGYKGTASVEYCWQPVDETRLNTAGRYLARIGGKYPPSKN
jgi:sugar phosphate isomerase/epimerase